MFLEAAPSTPRVVPWALRPSVKEKGGVYQYLEKAREEGQFWITQGDMAKLMRSGSGITWRRKQISSHGPNWIIFPKFNEDKENLARYGVKLFSSEAAAVAADDPAKRFRATEAEALAKAQRTSPYAPGTPQYEQAMAQTKKWIVSTAGARGAEEAGAQQKVEAQRAYEAERPQREALERVKAQHELFMRRVAAGDPEALRAAASEAAGASTIMEQATIAAGNLIAQGVPYYDAANLAAQGAVATYAPATTTLYAPPTEEYEALETEEGGYGLEGYEKPPILPLIVGVAAVGLLWLIWRKRK